MLRPVCACAPALSGTSDAFCAGAGNNNGNFGHGLRTRAQEQWAHGEVLLLIIWRVSEGNLLAQLQACTCLRPIKVIDSPKSCCLQGTKGSNECGTSKQEREFPAALCSCTAKKAQAVYGHGTYWPVGLVLYEIPLRHPGVSGSKLVELLEAEPLRKCCSTALQHVFSSRSAYRNSCLLPYVRPDNACMLCKLFSACFERQIMIWQLRFPSSLSL